jgi:hypothetical protein
MQLAKLLMLLCGNSIDLMQKKPKERHLDILSEANGDKHINFTALENKETDPADENNWKTCTPKYKG